ncbi:unnamed protein product [Ceutorhynchus assimilis]|uniref:ATP-dependent DNA helicase n=1 Tax=Ceutorhynchus assimilis TaxID=467358 RepID=A0A9N9QJS8_9CUCU|nr:unnamed protein product [Ceutorhynchus assimilis]
MARHIKTHLDILVEVAETILNVDERARVLRCAKFCVLFEELETFLRECSSKLLNCDITKEWIRGFTFSDDEYSGDEDDVAFDSDVDEVIGDDDSVDVVMEGDATETDHGGKIRIPNLNDEQMLFAADIIDSVKRNQNRAFVLMASGGTVFTGIAATLLKNGATAQTTFGLPLRKQKDPESSALTSSLSAQSEEAAKIGAAKLVVIDEVFMLSKWMLDLLENVCRLFSPDPNSTRRFGGKTVILSGDPKQLLPVVSVSSGRVASVMESIVASSVWTNLQKATFRRNMRLGDGEVAWSKWVGKLGAEILVDIAEELTDFAFGNVFKAIEAASGEDEKIQSLAVSLANRAILCPINASILFFAMASNRPLSNLQLQEILESDEFFEDLLVFDDSNEENIIPDLIKNPDETSIDGTIASRANISPTLVTTATDAILIHNNDIEEPEESCNRPDDEKNSPELIENNHIALNELTELDTNNDNNEIEVETVENQNSANTVQQEADNTNSEVETMDDENLANNELEAEPMEIEAETQRYKEEKDTRKRNKKLREKGCKYKTLRKNKITGKYSYENENEERKLRPTCQSVLCKKAKNRFCNTFTPLDRKNIFSNFWEMSWDMRKVYVSSLVKTTTTRRPKEDNSSRLLTFEYYLKKDTENLRICKKMFLNTLDLKEWMVRNWLNQAANNKIKDSNDIAMPSRSRLPVELKKGLEVLQTFLDKLPKLESHYCRPSTQRLYLEPLFQTKTDVYRLYKDYCDDNNAIALSLIHLKKKMNIKNIFVHKPKKDQCDVCIGYKTKNVSQENYETHIKRKDEARKEKEADKKMTMEMENKEIAVITMDLQSVKLAPVLQASAIYYNTKLCVHNFTTFNLVDKEVSCYLWHEAEGGLEANIFATLIVKHLSSFLEKNPHTKTIILFSDGCGYQNRNCILSNALYHFVNETGIIVNQKNLEKGHTQMEVDSVHSLIERKLKNKDINLPSDYIEVCKKARLKQPFEVNYLDHTWFLDYSKLGYYSSIRPGQKKTDLHVNDIRCLKYEKNNGISFKSNFSDNWTVLPQRLKSINAQISQLYKSRIKIKEQKYQHLQALKSVLPLDVHEFYDSLPH